MSCVVFTRNEFVIALENNSTKLGNKSYQHELFNYWCIYYHPPHYDYLTRSILQISGTIIFC